MRQQQEFKVLREHNVMVPMRDGTRLAADVFRPDAPGRFPVLVTRGPYGKDGYVANPDHSVWFFPKHGYAVVIQDCQAGSQNTPKTRSTPITLPALATAWPSRSAKSRPRVSR